MSAQGPPFSERERSITLVLWVRESHFALGAPVANVVVVVAVVCLEHLPNPTSFNHLKKNVFFSASDFAA